MSVMVDLVRDDGEHTYWSTHCRHGQHEACSADEIAPGVPRRPAQCKTCAAPCVCTCHQQNETATHGCIIESQLDHMAYREQYLVRCRCHMDSWQTWQPGDKPVTCPAGTELP